MTIPSTYAQAMCDAAADLLDSGPSAPTIVCKDGSSNVLITFTMDGGAAFGNATDACPAVATATNLPFVATATATGTIASATFVDGNGTDGPSTTSIGTTGSGADLEISDTSPTTGQSYTLTACSFQVPCS